MRIEALLIAGVLVAACSPGTEPVEDAANEAPVETASGPSVEPAAQKRMPLPDCGEVRPEDAGGDVFTHQDCRLQSADAAGLAFEARYSQPAPDQQQRIAIQVVGPGDATLQTIEETIEHTFGAPLLQDVDGDGRDELLVPLLTGNVNTTWAVWRATGEETTFKRIGELSGVDLGHTEDGYVTAAGRSSAKSFVVHYFRIENDALKPVVDVTVTALELGPDDKIVAETCEVEDAGGLAATGLDAAAAKAKFCEDPAATGIYQ
jgi:hypothetical protein